MVFITISTIFQFLREELKYDSGYEKRHKTFHYNDDTQISVKELWEAWLRSEVKRNTFKSKLYNSKNLTFNIHLGSQLDRRTND